MLMTPLFPMLTMGIAAAVVMMLSGIWEFAHPDAIALAVGLAFLLAALSLEGLVLWNATHQHN